MSDDLDRWLSVGDLDELLREVDRRCDRGDWAGVEQLRLRARAAIERGHQLWPAASFAEYRLALDAPPEWASIAVKEEAGRMAPGPLTEVVAQHHDWTTLGSWLEPSARRTLVAQERVLRGEVVDDRDCGELPGRLLQWEPDYALAIYHADGTTEFPSPELLEPTGPPVRCPETGLSATDEKSCIDGEDGALALHGALRHWATRSEGTVKAVGVEGGALDALAALGNDEVLLRECTLAEAGALLGWAAADGGSHGRRRGAATGRFELWWCLAVLAGVDDDWPSDPGPEASRLHFGLWLPDGPVTGWSCRVTVVDHEDGLAWALDAHDPAV